MGPERVESMIIGVVPSVLGARGADGGRVAVGTGGGRAKGEGVRDGVGGTLPEKDDEGLEGTERVVGVLRRSMARSWIRAS
jgi:hypothetical protein